MLEWYDLRIIDLYPKDEELDGGPRAPAGVIGDPREEVADVDEVLLPEEEVTAD